MVSGFQDGWIKIKCFALFGRTARYRAAKFQKITCVSLPQESYRLPGGWGGGVGRARLDPRFILSAMGRGGGSYKISSVEWGKIYVRNVKCGVWRENGSN